MNREGTALSRPRNEGSPFRRISWRVRYCWLALLPLLAAFPLQAFQYEDLEYSVVGEEISMTGRLVGRHADRWLTQWPHLAASEGPDYLGAVL